jgi:hypothetical protein
VRRVTRGLRARYSLGCSRRWPIGSPIWQPRVVPISCSTLAAGRDLEADVADADRGVPRFLDREWPVVDGAAGQHRVGQEAQLLVAREICVEVCVVHVRQQRARLRVSNAGLREQLGDCLHRFRDRLGRRAVPPKLERILGKRGVLAAGSMASSSARKYAAAIALVDVVPPGKCGWRAISRKARASPGVR